MKIDPTVLILLATDDSSLARISKSVPKANVRVGPWITEASQTVPPEMLKGVDVLLCELPPANFSDFDQLKWIQLTSAGYTQVLNLPILEKNRSEERRG